MKKITLTKSDFRKSQDRPNESLFEGVLFELGFSEEEMKEIDEIEIEVFSVTPEPI